MNRKEKDALDRHITALEGITSMETFAKIWEKLTPMQRNDLLRQCYKIIHPNDNPKFQKYKWEELPVNMQSELLLIDWEFSLGVRFE
jgi:hypothetical protein